MECSSGKTAYKTLNQAICASVTIAIKKARGSKKMRAYYCSECGHYHLTSHPSRENHEIYKNGHKYNRLKAKINDFDFHDLNEAKEQMRYYAQSM